MQPLIIFGSQGMGEIVQYSPLIKRFEQDYEVTLVLPDWHEPIFEGRFKVFPLKKYQFDLRKEGLGQRNFYLAPDIADQLGIPGNKWVFPLGDHVFLNHEEPPNKISREDYPPCELSLVEKMLGEYGLTTDDLEFSVGSQPFVKDERLTVVIANSGDRLRRLSIQTMTALMERFKGVRFVFVGSGYNQNYLNNRDNDVDFCWSYELDALSVKRCFQAVLASDLVVASDCGWAWVALASGKNALAVQSCVTVEALVPSVYWGDRFLMDRRTELTCDRACEAQQMVRQSGAGHDLEPKWHTVKGTNTESKRIWTPRPTLACGKTLKIDCMSYRSNDIDRLVEKMVRLCPALASFRV